MENIFPWYDQHCFSILCRKYNLDDHGLIDDFSQHSANIEVDYQKMETFIEKINKDYLLELKRYSIDPYIAFQEDLTEALTFLDQVSTWVRPYNNNMYFINKITTDILYIFMRKLQVIVVYLYILLTNGLTNIQSS